MDGASHLAKIPGRIPTKEEMMVVESSAEDVVEVTNLDFRSVPARAERWRGHHDALQRCHIFTHKQPGLACTDGILVSRSC